MTRRALAVFAVVAAGLIAPAGVAQASPAPAAPTGLHVASAGATSFTVAVNRSANATGYRLYASTTKSDLYYPITRGYHSRLYAAPRMTLAGLPRTSRPYYYRVVASTKTRTKLSAAIPTAGLQPSAPSSLAAAAGAAGNRLAWRSSWATSFVIAQATNSAMTTGRRNYYVGNVHRFTPYGLTRGVTYYFRVQAANYGSRSAWSGVTKIAATTSEQAVRVITYNLLKKTSDGTRNDNATEVIAPYAQRVVKQAALLKASPADVIGVQEAGYYLGSGAHPSDRQADALTRLLPGYRVAPTEKLSYPNYGTNFQGYVIYNTATVSLVDPDPAHCSCGVFEMDSTPGHRAIYAQLQLKSGARFLFVSPHLANPLNSDATRLAEVHRLLAEVASYNTAHLPVVYAGDFNSDMRKGKIDVPGNAMHVTLDEASLVAQTKYNAAYDSYNQYRRTPPRYGIYLDRIFVTPGVAVPAWGVVVQLSHGRFVGAIPSDHNPVYARVILPSS
ncbi:endonuclease/exonuclease/phosphatase family protein [uncultured Jatrophihabitans sp.]|uniref:endonuclease/exonuclease/phosphatase family protein n=1 Tax=uncultured Jatrophihabitans sp. TaxID=1610747 RepID=UPI0035CB2BAB